MQYTYLCYTLPILSHHLFQTHNIIGQTISLKEPSSRKKWPNPNLAQERDIAFPSAWEIDLSNDAQWEMISYSTVHTKICQKVLFQRVVCLKWLKSTIFEKFPIDRSSDVKNKTFQKALLFAYLEEFIVKLLNSIVPKNISSFLKVHFF